MVVFPMCVYLIVVMVPMPMLLEIVIMADASYVQHRDPLARRSAEGSVQKCFFAAMGLAAKERVKRVGKKRWRNATVVNNFDNIDLKDKENNAGRSWRGLTTE